MNINEFPQIEIFDLKGQRIKTIPVILSGVEGLVDWTGTDNSNNPVSSGTYYCRLNIPNSPVNKMLLLK